MEEGKRQKQVAAVIQQQLNTIFQQLNLSMMDGGMVSISQVKCTPDLLEARIYISLFQVADSKITLQKIEDRGKEIRKRLGDALKHQLRRIPVLKFYLDDTLEQVFRIEAIFKQIHENDEEKFQQPGSM